MKKFSINASIKTDNHFTVFKKVLEFENEEKAIEYAKETAKEMYYLNPLFDIVEIKLVRRVGEDEAFKIFNKQMEENIRYSAKEVI